MKIDRTRASRKAARRYNVSPVARAVRSVLTLSAAALMFSGTGVVLAKSPVVAPLPVERASLSHEFAKVVFDLTRVSDEWTPKSVVDEEFQAFAAPMGVAETSFAASATLEGFGVGRRPDDPAGLVPYRPGWRQRIRRCDPPQLDLSIPYDGAVVWNMDRRLPADAAVSTHRLRGRRVHQKRRLAHRHNYWDSTNVTGYTWAAGLEVESAGDIGAREHRRINVDGQRRRRPCLRRVRGRRRRRGDDQQRARSTSTATARRFGAFGMYAVGLGATAYDEHRHVNANGTWPATPMRPACTPPRCTAMPRHEQRHDQRFRVQRRRRARRDRVLDRRRGRPKPTPARWSSADTTRPACTRYSIYGDALVDNDGTLNVDGTNRAGRLGASRITATRRSTTARPAWSTSTAPTARLA